MTTPSTLTTASIHQDGATVADLIVTAIATYPDRPAFRSDDATVSFRELGQAISRIAQLFDSLGLRAGDAVAQLGVNRYEVYATVAAAYLRGLRSVTLHALGSEDDHAYILNDCGAKLVIVDEYHQSRGKALRERCGHIAGWFALGSIAGFDEFGQAQQRFEPAVLTPVGDAEHIVRIAYTGGTTGRPKGVQLSNRALVTNAVLDLSTKDWPEDVRYLCVAPISHGGGSLVTPVLARGGCVTLLRSFSPQGMVDAIHRHGCNLTWVVPTMLYALLDSDCVGDVDWSRFHSIIYSAAPAAPARLRQALDTLGPILAQSYGQSEAPNAILALGRHEHARLSDAQLASAGRPYPMIRVALLDDAGQPVPDGERGEICVRGPLVMSGYLNKPEETSAAIRDGWLHTGDIAYKDSDGLFYIVDRKKDMIISGGFNVYPKEVEDAICALPGVASAAVIGVPDEKWGEMVMAYVQLKTDSALTEAEIIEAVRNAKGPVAAPKRIAFVPELPLTALGKIDKKALRSHLRATR